MLKFPSELIHPTEARYAVRSGPLGFASISVELAPFELAGEVQRTALRCDQINLELADLITLAGRDFAFPPNPEPGYIDGSIYLSGAHVLFLTKSLSFGRVGDESIPLEIVGTLEFSSGRQPQYDDVVLSLMTALHLPLTTDQLRAMAEHAIAETAAKSPSDAGRVMAVLAKSRRAEGRMAELGAEVRRLLQLREASMP